jgi:hypothetical protein
VQPALGVPYRRAPPSRAAFLRLHLVGPRRGLFAVEPAEMAAGVSRATICANLLHSSDPTLIPSIPVHSGESTGGFAPLQAPINLGLRCSGFFFRAAALPSAMRAIDRWLLGAHDLGSSSGWSRAAPLALATAMGSRYRRRCCRPLARLWSLGWDWVIFCCFRPAPGRSGRRGADLHAHNLAVVEGNRQPRLSLRLRLHRSREPLCAGSRAELVLQPPADDRLRLADRSRLRLLQALGDAHGLSRVDGKALQKRAVARVSP